MGSLVRHNLEMMSRKHLWIRQLSQSSILEQENRLELPKRILTMTKKINIDPINRKNVNKNDDPMKDAIKMGRDIAIEQCIGHSTQVVKNSVFNKKVGK